MTEFQHKFIVADILEATTGRLVEGPATASFSDISTDSRTVQPLELFIPLEGERFDGHTFIQKAFDRGASGVLTRKGFSRGMTWNREKIIIEVEDPLKALGDIAQFWRMKHPIPVVGVTGSNGKTTTKEMIGKILETRFTILKTEGNFNNLVGLPLTLLKLEDRDEVAVLEMGTNTRFEIKRLAEILQPSIGVITNIGRAHLEGLRNLEEVAEEKGDLFKALAEENFAVVNEDDPRVSLLAAQCACKKVRFSTRKKADLTATEISMSHSGGVHFRLFCEGTDIPVNLPLNGSFNVLNALAAAGVARILGVDLNGIKEGLESFDFFSGRMEILEFKGNTIINDTYNANPDSVKEALKVLMGFKRKGRTIAVLGDMLELGEYSEGAHREVGQFVADLGVDHLLTLGQSSTYMAREAAARGMNPKNIHVGEGHKNVASELKAVLHGGDCVLIKGSRAMKMEQILEEGLRDRRETSDEDAL